MPNFIARNLKNTLYPFGAGEVEFLWEARGRKGERLVYTKSGDENFFIEVKKNAARNAFVIKGENLPRPKYERDFKRSLRGKKHAPNAKS